MRIGIDFDNTIVSYNELSHKVAAENSLIPARFPKSKTAVRDYLRNCDLEKTWTEIQGTIYGTRMCDAVVFTGVLEFIKSARDYGVDMVIISHRTLFPFLGPKYDLHKAARNWITHYLVDGKDCMFSTQQVYLELTREDKLARILDLNCDFFIDDLPEILLMSNFPTNTHRVLFDPDSCHRSSWSNTVFNSWADINMYFVQKWEMASCTHP